MCASYGLGGGPHDLELTFDLPPMHEPENQATIARWARENRGNARITGRKARNLNPLIQVPSGAREVVLGWWWLFQGSSPAPFSAFNSRDDALLRSWRVPFQRRAILPANWFVEKGATFALPNDELFGMAAITTQVAPPAGEPGVGFVSYSLVTRDAVGAVTQVNSRMPLVLPRSLHDEWLAPDRPGDALLISRAREASEELSMGLVAIGGGGGGGQTHRASGGSDAPTLF